jgi:GT2 family glycosyltransferase
MAERLTNVGAVIIGRNEGDRLKRCLGSLSEAGAVVYVDSGSTDGSAQWAAANGSDVIELDMRLPFTAARARNCGFRRILEIAPHLEYVQFIDGDCELVGGWLRAGVAWLVSRADVGSVCGNRRERFPERSVYNWLCDREWEGPPGEVRACGGDVMVRTEALQAIGGYREDMIAGEDPELCVRLRAAGWRVWRLDADMTLHDAAMTRFGQWWIRALRGGYAFALGAHLHGNSTERHWVWESRRAWMWGLWMPVGCLSAGLIFGPWGWATWLIFPLQMLRQVRRSSGPLKQRVTLALFHTLSHFAEVVGQFKFLRDRVFQRKSQLIEYK